MAETAATLCTTVFRIGHVSPSTQFMRDKFRLNEFTFVELATSKPFMHRNARRRGPYIASVASDKLFRLRFVKPAAVSRDWFFFSTGVCIPLNAFFSIDVG